MSFSRIKQKGVEAAPPPVRRQKCTSSFIESLRKGDEVCLGDLTGYLKTGKNAHTLIEFLWGNGKPHNVPHLSRLSRVVIVFRTDGNCETNPISNLKVVLETTFMNKRDRLVGLTCVRDPMTSQFIPFSLHSSFHLHLAGQTSLDDMQILDAILALRTVGKKLTVEALAKKLGNIIARPDLIRRLHSSKLLSEYFNPIFDEDQVYAALLKFRGNPKKTAHGLDRTAFAIATCVSRAHADSPVSLFNTANRSHFKLVGNEGIKDPNETLGRLSPLVGLVERHLLKLVPKLTTTSGLRTFLEGGLREAVATYTPASGALLVYAEKKIRKRADFYPLSLQRRHLRPFPGKEWCYIEILEALTQAVKEKKRVEGIELSSKEIQFFLTLFRDDPRVATLNTLLEHIEIASLSPK